MRHTQKKDKGGSAAQAVISLVGLVVAAVLFFTNSTYHDYLVSKWRWMTSPIGLTLTVGPFVVLAVGTGAYLAYLAVEARYRQRRR